MIKKGYNSINEDFKNDVSPAILDIGDCFTDEDGDTYKVINIKKVNSGVIIEAEDLNGNIGTVSYITAGGCNDRVYTITENEFNRLKKAKSNSDRPTHWISATMINPESNRGNKGWTSKYVYYQPNGKFNFNSQTAKLMTIADAKKVVEKFKNSKTYKNLIIH